MVAQRGEAFCKMPLDNVGEGVDREIESPPDAAGPSLEEGGGLLAVKAPKRGPVGIAAEKLDCPQAL